MNHLILIFSIFIYLLVYEPELNCQLKVYFNSNIDCALEYYSYETGNHIIRVNYGDKEEDNHLKFKPFIGIKIV